MQSTIAAYKRGIVSLNNLMDMLHVALVEVMPSVELARSAGFGWRGYVIRNYLDQLAYGHYVCQLRTDQPTILLMKEFFINGDYFYPWLKPIDLFAKSFFDVNLEGQKSILVNFYTEALREALEWQVSSKRKSTVPEKMLMGQNYLNTAHFDYPKSINRVSNEYVTALGQQSAILSHVKKLVGEEITKAGFSTPYIIYNASGWKYRGIWIKLRTTEEEKEVPQGSFPFKFKIDLFRHPEHLRFESDELNKVLDLEERNYFDLDESNQEGTLREFLIPIIQHMKEFC